jgi:hypothetical protein
MVNVGFTDVEVPEIVKVLELTDARNVGWLLEEQYPKHALLGV